MADFNVRSDSVNVELIMEQIRTRIREKRGVDYTEQQIRELAAVKLEKFLDPRGVRSDLLEQFRKVQPAYEPPELPNFDFGEETLFESHRGPVRWLRKLLMPILKLFFNPNPLIQALHIQSRLNTMNGEREARREAARRSMDQLYYELVHNLVLEITRLGIDNKNLKMRVESVSSRLEFNERRARALESAVVYKPSAPDEAAVQPVQRLQRAQTSASQQSYAPPSPPQPAPADAPPSAGPTPVTSQAQPQAAAGAGAPVEGPGQRSRRRRRRRGRRGGGPAAVVMGAPVATDPGTTSDSDSGASTVSDGAVDAIDEAPEHDEAPDEGTSGPSDPGPAPSTGSSSGGSDPDAQ
jgi:hypothetical protein